MPAARTLAVALVALALCAGPAAAGPITGIVAFGDSLTDTGNAYLGTGMTTPPSPPYFPGRFSNGPVWAEYLAGRLGVPGLEPAFFVPGGTNYAVGGAESGTGNSALGAPNLLTQVGAYLGSGPAPGPGTLFTVWAGANDFLNAGQTNPSVPVANVAAAISALAAAGGTRFVVPNLPDLGDVPGSLPLPPLARAGLILLSAQYNAELAAALDGLEASLGVRIDRVDVAGLYREARQDPAGFGFTNVTTGAVNDGVFSGQGYLFFDDLHPTTAGHRLLADRAFVQVTAVPEPASLALVGVAAAGFLGRVRRRRAAA